MCECLLQHGADVNSSDGVSHSCQLFHLFLIMVQVCVVPRNLCFGSKSSVGTNCGTGSFYLITGIYSTKTIKESLSASLKVHTSTSES